MLIASLGVLSSWYSGKIQNHLVINSAQTNRLVEITSSLEIGLYESLVYLSAIKESNGILEGQTTLNEPTLTLLIQQFEEQIDRIEMDYDRMYDFFENSHLQSSGENLEEANRLSERIKLYTNLSKEWLILLEEDAEQASVQFNTSISPFFRNNITPAISQLREQTLIYHTEEKKELSLQLSRLNKILGIAFGASVLLAVLISLYIYRSIANPLKKLRDGAQQLGQGNLDKEIEIQSTDEIGELAKSFNDMASNLKKRTLARDYLDSIIESLQESLIVTDEEKAIIGINKAGLKMLNYSREEIIGLPVTQFYDMESMGDIYKEKQNDGSIFEFQLLAKEDMQIPVLFSESDLINYEGEKVGSVCIATDITERKKSDQAIRDSLREKEVLLSEIHHRVKNNLAVVSGILQLQAYASSNDEVTKALTESQARIRSISLVHEMLYHDHTLAYINYKIYVNDLLDAISKMYMSDTKDISLNAEVEDISLDVNLAIPCSLLLNEIVVNSYKHAFDGVGEGKICVSMMENGEYYMLAVEDNGAGLEEDELKDSKSLGKTLIKTLTSQLKGEYQILSGKEGKGTRIEVKFPKRKLNSARKSY
ncbi:MAG: HAMP domain-containing protein [Balneola sp.]|nr:MAG: HAMP domain-containing protein [Balneola sp.]